MYLYVWYVLYILVCIASIGMYWSQWYVFLCVVCIVSIGIILSVLVCIDLSVQSRTHSWNISHWCQYVLQCIQYVLSMYFKRICMYSLCITANKYWYVSVYVMVSNRYVLCMYWIHTQYRPIRIDCILFTYIPIHTHYLPLHTQIHTNTYRSGRKPVLRTQCI